MCAKNDTHVNQDKGRIPATEDQKARAFEWLRSVALSDDPNARRAGILLQELCDAAIARNERDDLRRLHIAGCREAYKICGVEDDGEYRWKWVLLELARLKRQSTGAASEPQRKAVSRAGGSRHQEPGPSE